MATENTILLQKGYQLAVSADSLSSGYFAEIAPGSEPSNYTAVGASATVTVGPFASDKQYLVSSSAGELSVSKTLADVVDPGATAGTKNGSTVDVIESGDGAVHKTVFTLNSTPVTVTSVTTGNGVGGTLLYTFPEGYIKTLGCIADLSIAVETQGDFTDGTPEGDVGIGTVAPANADALGTDATDDNIATSTAFTMSSYAATANVPSEADLLIDGTSTAGAVYLNALVDAADIDDDTATDLLFSGTVTLVWANLGDY